MEAKRTLLVQRQSTFMRTTRILLPRGRADYFLQTEVLGHTKLMVEPFTYQVGLLLLLSMFTVNKRLPEFTVNVEFSSECKFYMLDRR